MSPAMTVAERLVLDAAACDIPVENLGTIRYLNTRRIALPGTWMTLRPTRTARDPPFPLATVSTDA